MESFTVWSCLSRLWASRRKSETLRAAWTGGFLRFGDRRFGLIEPPQVAGELAVVSRSGAGFTGDVRYRGLYQHGRRAVFEAAIGDRIDSELLGHCRCPAAGVPPTKIESAVGQDDRAAEGDGKIVLLKPAGGDLYALGSPVDADGWSVGIRSPDEPSHLSGTIVLRDRAVATSGDYEQYFDFAGRRYHHLLDPATGAPRVTNAHSLTVAASTCMCADAAATAVFSRNAHDAIAVLRGVGGDAEIVGSG